MNTKNNWVKTLWDKTVFPDKIKAKKDRKALERRLRAEVAEEAQPEIEKVMKEKYKKELMSKVKGEKKKGGKNILDTVAAGFGADPNAPKKEIDIAGMMGMGGSKTNTEDKMGMGNTNIASDDKIKMMLGTGGKKEEEGEEDTNKKTTKKKLKKEKKEKTNPFDVSDKISRMLE